MRYERALLLLNMLIVAAFALGILATAAVGLTALQSMPTIRVGQAGVAHDGSSFQLDLPVSVSNPGPLPLTDLGGNASLGADGTRLIGVRAITLNIPPGSNGTLLVVADMNLSEMDPMLASSMLFHDSNLSVGAALWASIAPFASMRLVADGTYLWGAPLGDLQVGQPRLLTGTDEVRVLIPVSFRNRSTMVPVDGSTTVTLLDQDGGEMGRFSVAVNAPTGSTFDGYLEGGLSIPANLSDLAFNDRVLECSLVMDVSIPGFYGLKIERPYQLVWGAPIGEPGIEDAESMPKNATHAYLVMNLTFVDGSSFVPVIGTLSGNVTDDSGRVVGAIEGQQVSVPPGGTFNERLAGEIENSALGGGLRILLRFDTAVGSFCWEADLDA